MTITELLREQFKAAHDIQEAVMADVKDKALHFTDIKKALPVGAAYAHSVISEDMIRSMMLAGKKPRFASEKTGLSKMMPDFSKWGEHEAWAHSVKIDLAVLRAYAKKVYADTDKYLAKLTVKDLKKTVETPMGKKSVLEILNGFMLLHTGNLTGEMSAIKGVQGLKGYPW